MIETLIVIGIVIIFILLLLISAVMDCKKIATADVDVLIEYLKQKYKNENINCSRHAE